MGGGGARPQRAWDCVFQLHLSPRSGSQFPGATEKSVPVLLPRAFLIFFPQKLSFALKGILLSVTNNIHLPPALSYEEFFCDMGKCL